jgi:hypothetical protein
LGSSALISKEKYVQLGVLEASGIALTAFRFVGLMAWGWRRERLA